MGIAQRTPPRKTTGPLCAFSTGGIMILRFPRRDAVALSVITLLAVLANLPPGYAGWLVNRDTLLAALIGVVVIALFHYLEAFLLMIITTLAVGANLPRELAQSLHVSQGIMLLALAAVIGITLINRVFGVFAIGGGADEEFEDEDTLSIDLSGPHERMIRAIEHGRLALVRQMIAADQEVNFKLNGTTPLHIAAEKGYSAIVQLLLEAGANPLAENYERETPLDIALSARKFAKTTDILYKATIPLLTPQEV
jgi:hypothetical protein